VLCGHGFECQWPSPQGQSWVEDIIPEKYGPFKTSVYLFLTKPPPNTWEEKPTRSWLSAFSPAGNAAWIVQLHSSLIAAGNS
jgi:hypothetical protein